MRIFTATFFCFSSYFLFSQNFTQTIRGRVVDATSKSELPGVQVVLYKDSSKIEGVQTDVHGVFRLQNVPIGRVMLNAKFIGYQPASFKIEVTSAKEIILNFEMEESAVKVQEVVVTASKKGEVRNEMATVSARVFSVEESNRYAGSRADVARMASNFAGVQGTDDSKNDIVIRGNSPMGLLWRLEGVDIPNPNHFAVAGNTGGPVNIINNKVLENSDFYTGAFPAEFGNGNSGVFDLKMRNGNNEKHEFTGQFGFLGTEVSGEGPIAPPSHKEGGDGKASTLPPPSGGRGSSYLFSYRYSTLKIFEALNIKIGTDAVPSYQDGAFKFNFPGKDGSNFSLFGVGGKSKIDILVSSYTEPSEDLYGDKDRDQLFGSSMGVLGTSYTKSLNEKTFIKVVAAHSGSEVHSHHIRVFRDSSYAIDSLVEQLGYKYIEQKSSLNFSISRKITTKTNLKAGLQLNYYNFNFLDSNRNSATWQFEKRNDYQSGCGMFQGFLQYRIKTSDKFLFTAGLHSQYFDISGSSSIEPRLGAKWNLKEDQTLSVGFGMHSQMQPTYIYFTHKTDSNGVYVWHNKRLGFTRSIHHVITYDVALSKNLRMKAEAYYQYIYEAPIDIYSSSYSVLNQGSGYDRFFPDTLTNKGTGKNIGTELTIEKFFSRNFFFMITASVFDSKYKGSDGVERNTDFNGNFAVNGLIAKEYKIGRNKNSVLTLGTKATYAGGRRYTPADTLASAAASEIVGIDSLRNTKRFKNYFRWDLKIGFRANRKKVTHELGLDVVNVLSTKNVLSLTYTPNPKNPTDVVRENYQLGFLPLFYYKIDF
ncbi:MAG: TonB-dependent receptor [Bacteroidetes bacterium]|nr:MAG: TonB-dependent receptor [Bacteroidota bacterium]